MTGADQAFADVFSYTCIPVTVHCVVFYHWWSAVGGWWIGGPDAGVVEAELGGSCLGWIVTVSCCSSKNSNDHDHSRRTTDETHVLPTYTSVPGSINSSRQHTPLLLFSHSVRRCHRAPPLDMSVATAQKPGAVHVPRLVLPCSQTGDDVGNAQFRRQINVALGRSHSQRTPRRDVSFRVQQGVRLEKQQRPQLFASSSARIKPSGGGVDGMLSSPRCIMLYSEMKHFAIFGRQNMSS